MTGVVLLLKISVPPVLVALMSLAARRWGPTIGGLIMGLPWMTGPIVYFLGLDNGIDYLVAVTRGVELAVWAIGTFILAFAHAARFCAWPLSIVVAIMCYAAVAWATQSLSLPLGWTALVSALLLLATYRLLPHPATGAALGRMPSWDIPARLSATFVLVSVIMFSAELLGPQRSGILASYPVILTVIGVFTLRQWGRDALFRILRGMTLSLLAFVGFFAVVGFGAPMWGQTAAFAVAAGVAVAISGGLIALSRTLLPRATRPA